MEEENFLSSVNITETTNKEISTVVIQGIETTASHDKGAISSQGTGTIVIDEAGIISIQYSGTVVSQDIPAPITGTLVEHFKGWQGGILMSAIAFSIVFLVIAGLMFMMMALKHIVKAINPDKPTAARTGNAKSAPPSQSPTVVAAVRYEPPASDEGELVAVFAAAVTAMSGHAAAVLSYSPVEAALRRHTASAWKMTGILSNSRGLRD